MNNLMDLKYNIDKVMSQAKNISCTKGCTHCCHLGNVDIIPQEGELILDWIEEKNIKIDEKALEIQMNNKVKDLSIQQRRCILLNKKNECSIYDIRPMTCRKLIVSSPPENCNYQNEKKVIVEENIKVEKRVNNLLYKYKAINMANYIYENRN